MLDVQARGDTRGVPLDRVGVTDLLYPIVVLDRARERQHTTARLTMSVSLPHHFKGTHMSRFLEVLNENRGEFTLNTLPQILSAMCTRLDAESARIEARFHYFLERAAPVSGARGLMDYECAFVGELKSGAQDFILSVKVPVTSLCPCSKEISDYGAHNQRGTIAIDVRSTLDAAGQPRFVWIEDLVEVAEGCASAPVYPLLKRADERHVTMQAYDNPVFVEDMVRNVAVRLKADERIAYFAVNAVNVESIHNHSAFASAEWRRP
jgi:GTP cyclohydrolase I